MSLPNICDETSELCKETQELLDGLIEKYQTILKMPGPSENILKHSGSAPIEGWVECISGSYTIGQAIHVRAINSHYHAEQHYRDNYVWHAWLKNNLEYLIFKHDSTGPQGLPILHKVLNSLHKVFSLYEEPIVKEISSVIDPRSNLERFEEAFKNFNEKFPIIGLIHRCLIIIRYFNEQISNKISDENITQSMELQKIYYPIFYFINLFIHIGMLYYSIDTANYDAIIKTLIPFFAYENLIKRIKANSTKPINKKILKPYINISQSDFDNKSSPNFVALKQTLLDILTEFYSHISELYMPIKELIQENVESSKISEYNIFRKKQEIKDIKIDNLDTPYFDATVAFLKPITRTRNSPRTMGSSARSPPRARANATRLNPTRTRSSTGGPARLNPTRTTSSTGGPARANQTRSPSRASSASSRSPRARSPRRNNSRTLSQRSKKKSNLKEMGFNERHINRAIENNPEMNIIQLIDVIPNYQLLGRQDSPAPSTSSIGYGQLSSGVSASGVRNNVLNLTRAEIIRNLSSYGITESNTSFITENMGIIIENLLSKIPGYTQYILSVDEKIRIAEMYETMLLDYIDDSYFEGRENDITHTSMNVVRIILSNKRINIPDEINQRQIFSINALVKEILNILVRN